MIELFLICALAVPTSSHTRPRVVSYHAMTEEEISDRIRQIHKVDEVFIHESPVADKMREHGWERAPYKINGKEVWVKRKIHHDTPQKRAMEASA